MKTLSLLATAMLLQLAVFGQLQLTEQFNNSIFTTSGDLGTQNSWMTTTGSPDVQVFYRPSNSGALVYPGYSSGQTSVFVAKTNGKTPYKLFNASIPTNADGVIYMIFVVRPTDAGNGNSPIVSFRTLGGAYRGAFFIDKSVTSVRFGINKAATGGSYTSAYPSGSTYMILIRYDIFNGDNNDNMYMWVNPTSLISEPTIASATVSVTSGADNSTDQLNSLALIQNNNGAEAEFDAFKVALGTGQSTLAANSAAAWSNLSPQGAPLPVKLGNITAFQKQGGVQLDWTAYSEENLLNYEIERSSDGAKFITIGNISARNSTEVTKYGFLDVTPASGINFYRLKHSDIDGKYGFSNIVKVDLGKGNADFSLYPNPVQNGYVSFQAPELAQGEYLVKVIDLSGKNLFTNKINHKGGFISQVIQLPTTISKGQYYLQLESVTSKIMTRPFLVQ